DALRLADSCARLGLRLAIGPHLPRRVPAALDECRGSRPDHPRVDPALRDRRHLASSLGGSGRDGDEIPRPAGSDDLRRAHPAGARSGACALRSGVDLRALGRWRCNPQPARAFAEARLMQRETPRLLVALAIASAAAFLLYRFLA